jgi:hypothetical protein
MSGRHPYSIGPRPDPEDLRAVDAPEESWWWVPVAVVATAVPVSALAVAVVDLLGSILPAGGIPFVMVYWAFVVGCWLFSPLAVHLDGRHVAEVSGWVPPAYYYAVFVPGLGAVVAAAYVVQRYRHAGFE